MWEITKPSRGKGRPPGQFASSRKRVFQFFLEQGRYSGSNEDLGSRLGCSARQAQRYVTSLKEIDAIAVRVTKCPAGPKQWFITRTIWPLKQEI